MPASQIAAVRRFNRFYTREIGVLRSRMLGGPFSLSELRVLYELAHRGTTTARDIGRDLGMDAGYLSRLLARFEARGLLARTRAAHDGREALVSLTRRGADAFAPLEARQQHEVGAMLSRVPAGGRPRLIAARGLGVGAQLVGECVRFAKACGYRRVTLWTQSELHAARRLYERFGFRRTATKKHRSFGKRLVAETWDLDLSGGSAAGR